MSFVQNVQVLDLNKASTFLIITLNLNCILFVPIPDTYQVGGKVLAYFFKTFKTLLKKVIKILNKEDPRLHALLKMDTCATLVQVKILFLFFSSSCEISKI